MVEQDKSELTYAVWNGPSIIGCVFRGPDGAVACDSALEPYARAVLAEAEPENTYFTEAPAHLAFAVAKRVGPEFFAYPEGIDPSGPIDSQDRGAMVAVTIRASREAGELVIVYDCDSDWRAGRKRLQEQRAKEAQEKANKRRRR